jgi:hypothetical protein
LFLYCAYAQGSGRELSFPPLPVEEQPYKKEVSFVLRVVEDPMFGSTAGENLASDKGESIAESLQVRLLSSVLPKSDYCNGKFLQPKLRSWMKAERRLRI